MVQGLGGLGFGFGLRGSGLGVEGWGGFGVKGLGSRVWGFPFGPSSSQEHGQAAAKSLNIFVLNTHEAIAQLPFTLMLGRCRAPVTESPAAPKEFSFNL